MAVSTIFVLNLLFLLLEAPTPWMLHWLDCTQVPGSLGDRSTFCEVWRLHIPKAFLRKQNKTKPTSMKEGSRNIYSE